MVRSLNPPENQPQVTSFAFIRSPKFLPCMAIVTLYNFEFLEQSSNFGSMSPIVFFFLLLRIDDDSNVMILSHTTSGMQYEESTPVTSDINTAQKKV